MRWKLSLAVINAISALISVMWWVFHPPTTPASFGERAACFALSGRAINLLADHESVIRHGKISLTPVCLHYRSTPGALFHVMITIREQSEKSNKLNFWIYLLVNQFNIRGTRNWFQSDCTKLLWSYDKHCTATTIERLGKREFSRWPLGLRQLFSRFFLVSTKRLKVFPQATAEWDFRVFILLIHSTDVCWLNEMFFFVPFRRLVSFSLTCHPTPPSKHRWTA